MLKKLQNLTPEQPRFPSSTPNISVFYSMFFSYFTGHMCGVYTIASGDAGPPASSAGRLPTQHFDIPGPDYITLSATINRGYAIRNVMIPLLSQNLLDSDETEDLHR